MYRDKEFGEGKVRQLTRYFESKPLKYCRSKSTPNLICASKLNDDEKCKVLKQLKEWSANGTSGKDYILDFNHQTQNLPPIYRSDSCSSMKRCCCCCRRDFDHGCSNTNA